MKKLKLLFWRILGKHPEAVVLSFASGSPDKVKSMIEEARRLIPDRRHFLTGEALVPGLEDVEFIPFAELSRRMRPYRVGMMPVLFDGTARFAFLRRRAFRLAPFRILGYNERLERHHLHYSTPISSWLFWRGVPLDRIHMRPRGLRFLTADRTVAPNDAVVIEGRPPRSNAPRIGILTPFAPYPLSHGGAVRLFYMIRALSRRFNVYLFAFREHETPESLRPLLDFVSAIGLVTKPRYREPRWSTLLPPEVHEYESAPMRRMIESMRKERHIQIIQVEYTQLARYSGDILVEHDVTFDLYSQVHERERTWTSWWDLLRWRWFEKRAISRFRKVVVMSSKDAALLESAHSRVIPNGVDLKRFQPTPEPPGCRLLFIGSFRHFPNITALRFFLDRIWPLVQSSLPDASITIVAGPDPEIYWGGPLPVEPAMEIRGFVADVRPLYEQSNIVLVPTLVSAGTNVKVLEAMAMNRAIVSTPSGCGGIDVRHQEHVLIAANAEAFASAIIRLARDPSERVRLAANARFRAEQLYDWGKLGEMQCSLVEELLPDPISIRRGASADFAAVRAIQREALPSSRWDAEHYIVHEFYVAIHDHSVAGFIVARQTAGDEREILNIAVAPQFRNLGIGERLIRTILNSGVPGEVFLEVRESNTTAQRLYESIGFVEAGRRKSYYEDPPETAVIMRIRV